ncbi:anaphase-promoting complex, subunit 10-domain-containing protein [Hypoxylon sp. NC1633]|nr:anaphase-promoting complex, subunit 10-domain-containing protein [Hypoxylon sp. NC1633]
MEPQDVGPGERVARNHASLRQHQEEFRRRLMRPNRISRVSDDHNGDPFRNGASEPTEPAEPAEPLATLSDSTRPDLQWTDQTSLTDVGGIPNEEDGDAEAAGEAWDDQMEEDEGPNLHGLKEISNLASFTVSSYKPGCGVKELLSDDIHQFWQSDGPQPHRLNIHFIKRVEIRKLRLYLDYELDESYTPTKIQITAGFSPNQTIPFTVMEMTSPQGWIDVPIEGAGGGADGNSLACWFVRVIVLENHQNGKDTHIRGVKVYAIDDTADTAVNNPIEDMVEMIEDQADQMARQTIDDDNEEALARFDAAKQERKAKAKKHIPGEGGLSIPDFMREPELR